MHLRKNKRHLPVFLKGNYLGFNSIYTWKSAYNKSARIPAELKMNLMQVYGLLKAIV